MTCIYMYHIHRKMEFPGRGLSQMHVSDVEMEIAPGGSDSPVGTWHKVAELQASFFCQCQGSIGVVYKS